MAQSITKKKEMINRILGIINGDMPGNRFGMCICWDEDPEQPEPNSLNVFMVDGRQVTYQDWKKFFGKIEIDDNEQKTNS